MILSTVLSTILAIAEMSSGVQALIFAIAAACILVVVFRARTTRNELFWIALGLVFFIFVFFWLALQAS